MAFINKNLITLKLFLFWTYAALGSLWPFITIHMKSLGLTIEETAIINLILPFTSLLGPPLAGALADKIGRYRLVLVLCMVFAGISYSALLFVPPVVRHKAREPSVSFSCNANAGVIHLERCGRKCEFPTNNYEMELSDCHTECSIPSSSPVPDIVAEMDDVPDPQLANETTLQQKPVLCFQQQTRECHVYNSSGLNESIVLNFNVLHLIHNGENECQYQLNTFTRKGSEKLFTGMKCNAGDSNLCQIKCRLRDKSQPLTLQSPRCIHVEGDPFLTFWIYFLIRGIAELFPPSCLALLDATILNMVRKHHGQYGKQILWGITAIGIFPPIVGFCIDHFNQSSGHVDYTPAFIAFDAFLLIAAILAIFLDTERTEYMQRLCRHVGKLLRNTEVLMLFVVVFTLGTQFGFVETFLYWFLEDLGATKLLLGLTLTAGVVPSLPFLYFGDRIVKKVGSANLLIIALFVYSIRFTGYSYIPGPWWSLPFEALEVFTLNLMWVTTATYCARLAPRMLLATTMGLTTVLHYNAGRGVGALAGGYVMDKFGPRLAYQGSAVFSGFMGLIYFSIYHFYLKDRKRPIIIESATNGHHSPAWEQRNANGDAQAIKPILDSKNADSP